MPHEPSGEDLCIRQMDGCNKKTVVDPKRLDLNGGLDVMGLSDPLVEYEHSAVDDSCLFSVVTSFLVLCVSQHFVLCVFCVRLRLVCVTPVVLAGLCAGSYQVFGIY